ncbi:MAG: hypothetical protein GF329_19345 [Candidatus Lokiarchaeota archaeon]|nr:hypothetical protein [Candidatus Lokiarchaeota archaeon]
MKIATILSIVNLDNFSFLDINKNKTVNSTKKIKAGPITHSIALKITRKLIKKITNASNISIISVIFRISFIFMELLSL